MAQRDPGVPRGGRDARSRSVPARPSEAKGCGSGDDDVHVIQVRRQRQGASSIAPGSTKSSHRSSTTGTARHGPNCIETAAGALLAAPPGPCGTCVRRGPSARRRHPHTPHTVTTRPRRARPCHPLAPAPAPPPTGAIPSPQTCTHLLDARQRQLVVLKLCRVVADLRHLLHLRRPERPQLLRVGVVLLRLRRRRPVVRRGRHELRVRLGVGSVGGLVLLLQLLRWREGRMTVAAAAVPRVGSRANKGAPPCSHWAVMDWCWSTTTHGHIPGTGAQAPGVAGSLPWRHWGMTTVGGLQRRRLCVGAGVPP